MAKIHTGLLSKWYFRPALALGIVGIAAIFARDYQPSKALRSELASQFRFSRSALPNYSGLPHRTIREVNPSLASISGWISSVGAGIAIADITGTGMPADYCLVDPRTDSVTVAPIPKTGERYKPFILNPSPLFYDAKTMAPMGCVPADLNEDGHMDLLVYYWGRSPIMFLWNGTNFVAQDLLAKPERWYSNAAVFADLDGSGHLALVVGNYFPDESHILFANSNTHDYMQTSMAKALNGGSKRFFLFASASGGANTRVDYQEVQNVVDDKVGHGWTLAIGAQDLTGDLLPELFFANDFGPDRFLLNESTPGKLKFRMMEGKGGFTIPPSKVMGQDSFKGMGVEFVDLWQTGVPTILISNITVDYGLHESQQAFVPIDNKLDFSKGYVPFIDKSEELGLARRSWGWDIKSADFNNSGFPQIVQAVGFVRGETNRWPDLQELAMGNNGVMSLPRSWPNVRPGDNLAGHVLNPFNVYNGSRYIDIAEELGHDEAAVSRGVAMADVDGDGRMDYAIANQWGDSSYYHNDSVGVGAFVGLRLMLPIRQGEYEKTAVLPQMSAKGLLGRPAVGATVRIHLADNKVVHAQVDGGNGHSGKRSPDLHFGLGKDFGGKSVQVEIAWRDPSGKIHRETHSVTTGWNVLMLAWPTGQPASDKKVAAK